MNETRQILEKVLTHFVFVPSDATQQVTLSATYDEPIPFRGLNAMVDLCLRHINFGLGAGGIFAPAAGVSRLLSKPSSDAGDSAVWIVEVSSVAPEFWLSIAQLLSIGFISVSGGFVSTRTVAISGSLLSDQQARDRNWLLGVCDPSASRYYQP